MSSRINRKVVCAVSAAASAICLGSPAPVEAAWSFGVIGDTQWTCPGDPEGTNAGKVSSSVIRQINDEFIAKGVKLVIQVGDLSNASGNMAMRAAAAQQLYDAGIGFFPMRGNHDAAALDSLTALRANFPQTQGMSNTFGASNFSSPTVGNSELLGISYAFDYVDAGGSARFVILDDWSTPTKSVVVPEVGPKYPYGYSIGEQQEWISRRLDVATRLPEHAFVLAHHNLIGENHSECLFSGLADANIDMQNAFFASLYNNDVRYFISGHEHLAQRSLVASPDRASQVQEIISAPAGPKFINPKDPNSADFRGQKVRQTQLSQELNNVGFYIYTIDGARVTVDYYSDVKGGYSSDRAWPNGGPPTYVGSQITPDFEFVKKDTWGYSLNGQEFVVGQGQSYTTIVDGYGQTSASILGGSNGSTGTDFWGRAFSKHVTTGWVAVEPNDHMRSDILSLWGMAAFGETATDEFVLRLSYQQGRTCHLGKGGFGIATRDASGAWVNAVNQNTGGTKRFVKGPWKPEYGLGTYGVVPSEKKVWAVLNYNGDFAAANSIEDFPGCD